MLRHLGLDGASLPPSAISEIVNTWPDLRLLELYNADWINSLAPIATLPLRLLVVSGRHPSTDIAPIARLGDLRALYLGIPVSDLKPITALQKLEYLVLEGTDHAIDLTPIAALTGLRELSLYDAPEDIDLAPLAMMRGLKIILNEGQHVQGIGSLHQSARIEWRIPPKDPER
jgi:hypothetical protein